MKIFSHIPLIGSYIAVTTLIAGGAVAFTNVAHAAGGKACYEQFNAAKKAGTLTQKTFKEFKAANCDAEQGKSVDKTAVKDEKPTAEPAKETTKEAPKQAVVKEKTLKTTGDVVFPEKVNSKFANEKEGKARMMTCQEQYKANKETNKNGGLKWIQKGGGYYSECNKHLKATASK